MSKPIYASFRRYLPADSVLRQRVFELDGIEYMFPESEDQPPPEDRTDLTTAECTAIASRTHPYRGHKAEPFMILWRSVDWEGNICDMMHDIKCTCAMLLKCLVGSNSSHGMYKSWKKDDKHRMECAVFGIFQEVVDGGPLPWRLTKEDLKTVNKRICSMWWPHYMDKLCSDGYSFFIKSNRAWKCRNVTYVFLVLLTTCLRGFVPAVHRALLVLVYALRRLDGQVVSKAEAESLGLAPGTRVLKRSTIQSINADLVRGLVMLEGSLPRSFINPAMHHFVHYGAQTRLVGCLRWFSMYAFERNNKKIKGLVKNGNRPLSCLGNNILMDISTRL